MIALSTCCFCTHLNPPGAKFCNECASPLHLKPCTRCDAVNARDAEACYRCAALFQAEPTTADASPERVVADADATLAALRRDLDATAVTNADAPLPTSAPRTPVLEQEIARAARGEGSGRPVETHAEPTFDVTSIAVAPEDRQWRPERRSRSVLFAIAVGLVVVLPAAVYLMRNPAQLDEWFGRSGVPTVSESPAGDATPAAPTVTAPVAAPALSTAADAAPAASPAEDASSKPSTPDSAAVPDQQALPVSPTGLVAPTVSPAEPAASASDPPGPVAANPERQAKSTQGSRARGPAPKARPRERATKPRPQAPGGQNQRSSEQATTTTQVANTEPCTEAVAALGLCVR